MSQQPSVLVVTPERHLLGQIQQDLQAVGYGVMGVATGRQALQSLDKQAVALVVIDVVHLAAAGVKLCQDLRAQGDRTAILLLFERESLSDRITCLEAGADDYLLLPYRSEYFTEQVNFYVQAPASPTAQLQFGDLSLELNTRRAMRGTHSFDLTMKEFELLKYLMQHPLQVVTREQILQNVWGYDFIGESNVIEVYIRYLRLKLEDKGGKRLIQTVRGVGYVLREA
ncbi:MAG: response regulator transcription factor [Cyanobacteria bacterium P01_G01_bin.54]